MDFSKNLKDYDLQRLIGQGTFGKVYKGLHKPSNAQVAVKIVDFEKLKKNKNGVSRIKSEIASQSKLNHDGIIRLHQSFITVDGNGQQQYVLILEYCDGGNLHDYLKKQKGGKLSESNCFPIFYQLVDIVRYLHQNEIIHRDLKLQNILICGSNNASKSKSKSKFKTARSLRIKLCDFGLAASTSISPDRYTMCGTPNFVAPEIAKHQKHSHSVDVWSLGIILFTLLTGSPPFHTGNTRQTLHKVINHKKINVPDSLSHSVRSLIHKLLHKVPLQRITIHEILSEKWFLQKGRSLKMINIDHLKSRQKTLTKWNVTIEITESEGAKIWWNDR